MQPVLLTRYPCITATTRHSLIFFKSYTLARLTPQSITVPKEHTSCHQQQREVEWENERTAGDLRVGVWVGVTAVGSLVADLKDTTTTTTRCVFTTPGWYSPVRRLLLLKLTVMKLWLKYRAGIRCTSSSVSQVAAAQRIKESRLALLLLFVVGCTIAQSFTLPPAMVFSVQHRYSLTHRTGSLSPQVIHCARVTKFRAQKQQQQQQQKIKSTV